ncbi:MAG: hypothetical protein ACLTTH_09650 [Holdemanella porci]
MSAQNQATDRAYRIGQTKNVLVYQLLMKEHNRSENLRDAEAQKRDE